MTPFASVKLATHISAPSFRSKLFASSEMTDGHLPDGEALDRFDPTMFRGFIGYRPETVCLHFN